MSDNPTSRRADYDEIEKGLKSKDPFWQRQARIAKDKLDRESPKVRQLRDELVKAHREHNRIKVDDLHKRLEELKHRG